MRMVEAPRMDLHDDMINCVAVGNATDGPALRLAGRVGEAADDDKANPSDSTKRRREQDWRALVDCFSHLAKGVSGDYQAHRTQKWNARLLDGEDEILLDDDAFAIGQRLARMSHVRERIKAGRYESEGKLRVVCLRMLETMGDID